MPKQTFSHSGKIKGGKKLASFTEKSITDPPEVEYLPSVPSKNSQQRSSTRGRLSLSRKSIPGK